MYVNDKKVTTASRMIKVGDRVKVTGFMGSGPRENVGIDQEAAPLALNAPRSIPGARDVAAKRPLRGGSRGCPSPL